MKHYNERIKELRIDRDLKQEFIAKKTRHNKAAIQFIRNRTKKFQGGTHYCIQSFISCFRRLYSRSSRFTISEKIMKSVINVIPAKGAVKKCSVRFFTAPCSVFISQYTNIFLILLQQEIHFCFYPQPNKCFASREDF